MKKGKLNTTLQVQALLQRELLHDGWKNERNVQPTTTSVTSAAAVTAAKAVDGGRK